MKNRVYQFWSRSKNSISFVLTEKPANNIAEVRRWAKDEGVEIEKNRIWLKK